MTEQTKEETHMKQKTQTIDNTEFQEPKLWYQLMDNPDFQIQFLATTNREPIWDSLKLVKIKRKKQN